MNGMDLNAFGRVGVLMGGTSSEREISLRSGNAVLNALQSAGVDAVAVDLSSDWADNIRNAAIDRAFNVLHGTLGEDGCVQGMLEVMGVPYTGAGVLASALCMHKQLCKQVLNHAGLKTPVDIPLHADGPLRYPVIVKPVAEGSSVGLHRLTEKRDWDALSIDIEADQWMAEMPVEGVEIAVAVLDGKALPAVEVVPKSGVYDYTSKYTAGATEYFCPARLPAETLRYCMLRAEEAVVATGCSGAPRVDMIVTSGGEPYILEVNTLPGMTETSLLPKSAAAAGIDFETLCLKILVSAATENQGVAHA
ncbi:D-alanine-D-alanine ligase [Mariprofundus micogutta]|uniref:D-alanine--D-alanine ligase n=1 Tax=Mariprofundus micogutta TaxID=1921010 RepID=A0A1L8CL07_9PROT|nr:D-alanine--D-alanine ligase [Mariprofundus micogutta]GAV19529.1 D-alanine-D-alanine ligase [Mariprofundus micogutta]